MVCGSEYAVQLNKCCRQTGGEMTDMDQSDGDFAVKNWQIQVLRFHTRDPGNYYLVFHHQCIIPLVSHLMDVLIALRQYLLNIST